jgi:hypothetical protein
MTDSAVKPAMILKNISASSVTDKGFMYPYADDADVIDGQKCSTCGLARVPFMERDIVSDVRQVSDSKGHVRDVVDIYLYEPEYMVYYRREYIVHFTESGTVEETSRGHYGDFTPVKSLADRMSLGRKVLNKARHIAARQQRMEAAFEKKRMVIMHDSGMHAGVPSADFND